MPAKFKIKMDTSKLFKAISKAERRYLFKSGGYARKAARSLILVNNKPSRPGRPPKSPTGVLKNSIMFDVNLSAGEVLIGPTFYDMHEIGELHEFGGTRNGRRYPPRPYMQPALIATLGQLPILWDDSIK